MTKINHHNMFTQLIVPHLCNFASRFFATRQAANGDAIVATGIACQHTCITTNACATQQALIVAHKQHCSAESLHADFVRGDERRRDHHNRSGSAPDVGGAMVQIQRAPAMGILGGSGLHGLWATLCSWGSCCLGWYRLRPTKEGDCKLTC